MLLQLSPLVSSQAKMENTGPFFLIPYVCLYITLIPWSGDPAHTIEVVLLTSAKAL